MTKPRALLIGILLVWSAYATHLLTAAGAEDTPPLTAGSARGAVLAVLTAGLVIAVELVLYELIDRKLEQLRTDVADWGDRREITGHEIATRAYTNGGRSLRSVDS